MKGTSAVICEFNPLHSGHEALLKHAASVSDTLVCVMSGNFTQRSECAVFDKYKRAEAAVRMGADVVLELPFPYSSAGAEFFAFGGVSVGYLAGAEHFIFGSESGDTDYVKGAHDAIKSAEFAELLSSVAEAADGAAVRYDRAMSHFGYTLGANDKLGTFYMAAAEKLGANVTFEAYLRMCDTEHYRSATELRRIIFEKGSAAASPFIPEPLLDVYTAEAQIEKDKLSEIIYNYYRLRGETDAVFFEGEGGVDARLRKAAAEAAGHGEFFAKAATKRYTDSRLRRAALFALLGIRKGDVMRTPSVTVLLGASEKGREYLSAQRKEPGIKILTKPSDSTVITDEGVRQLSLMRRADELYALCLREKVPAGEYLRKRPYIE